MKREYVECECGTIEHMLRFTWNDDPDWPEIYVDVYLNQRYGLFKRLWYGLKYIFGFKSRFGQFDEATMSYEKVEQLKVMCDKWLETHHKAPLNKEEELKVAKIMVKMQEKRLEEVKKQRDELCGIIK
jgi:hypothetical protein